MRSAQTTFSDLRAWRGDELNSNWRQDDFLASQPTQFLKTSTTPPRERPFIACVARLLFGYCCLITKALLQQFVSLIFGWSLLQLRLFERMRMQLPLASTHE